jgi:hypothetical protein
MDDERISLQLANGADFNVPLAYLSYLCLRVPQEVDDPALFLARLDKSKRPRDVMYLTNGDSIEGTLAAPARGPVYTMNLGDRKVDTPLDQLAILAVNTELQARPKAKKTFARVITTGGARVHFSTLRVDNSGVQAKLSGKTLFGAMLRIPLSEVAAVSLHRVSAEYLSDLTPKRYQFTPFLGVTWPLVRDAAISGRQLAVGDDFYDKGLAMHAKSHVAYALEGKYRWFEALVGLERSNGGTAQVKISVFLDGKPALTAKTLTGRDPAFPIRLDVRAARELALLVDFGDFGDVRGRVNWADARLLREEK